MITKEQEKAIKEFLGRGYTTILENYFIEFDIQSKYKKPFSGQFILMVLNRDRESRKVESGIWDCVEHTRKLRLEQENKQDKILESIKK